MMWYQCQKLILLILAIAERSRSQYTESMSWSYFTQLLSMTQGSFITQGQGHCAHIHDVHLAKICVQTIQNVTRYCQETLKC